VFVSNALSGTVQHVSLTEGRILKTQMVGGLPGNIALLPDRKKKNARTWSAPKAPPSRWWTPAPR
jgi:hypothetical protein